MTPSDSPESKLAYQSFCGQYEVREELKAHRVYRCWDNRNQRMVVIKMLAAGEATECETVLRHQQEKDIFAKISHPRVPGYLGYRYDKMVGMIIVIEDLRGETLASILGNPMPLEQVLEIVAGLATALSHLHQYGIIHRGLKGENVILSEHGLKLFDFSHSKMLVPRFHGLTHAGEFLGNYRYSPSDGDELAEEITPAVDVHALGGLTFEMLTGTKLKEQLKLEPNGSLDESLAAIRHPALRCLVSQMLDSNPKARPSASEVQTAVERMLTELNLKPTFLQRHRSLMIASGIAAGVLLALVLWLDVPSLYFRLRAYQTGVAKIDRDGPRKAFSYFDVAHQENPSNQLALLGKAETLWRAGKDREAFKILEEIKVNAQGPEILAPCHLLMGNVLMSQNQNAKARHQYLISQSFYEQIGKDAGVLAIKRNLATMAMGEERYHEAELIFMELVEREPNAADYYNLAICVTEQGMTREAKEYAFQAIDLDVENRRLKAKALNLLGFCELKIGAKDLAINYLDEAYGLSEELGLDLVRGYAAVHLAYAHFSVGNTSQAEHYYSVARQISDQEETVTPGLKRRLDEVAIYLK